MVLNFQYLNEHAFQCPAPQAHYCPHCVHSLLRNTTSAHSVLTQNTVYWECSYPHSVFQHVSSSWKVGLYVEVRDIPLSSLTFL